jgi:hypothetical protein
MLRCHTNGLYRGDTDAQFALQFDSVQGIANELDGRAAASKDGFSRLYGRMVRQYFGGMVKHLMALRKLLPAGARCAYVVRDTRALSKLHIDTPKILSNLACSAAVGFQFDGVSDWKRLKGTRSTGWLHERILFFSVPKNKSANHA